MIPEGTVAALIRGAIRLDFSGWMREESDFEPRYRLHLSEDVDVIAEAPSYGCSEAELGLEIRGDVMVLSVGGLVLEDVTNGRMHMSGEGFYATLYTDLKIIEEVAEAILYRAPGNRAAEGTGHPQAWLRWKRPGSTGRMLSSSVPNPEGMDRLYRLTHLGDFDGTIGTGTVLGWIDDDPDLCFSFLPYDGLNVRVARKLGSETSADLMMEAELLRSDDDVEFCFRGVPVQEDGALTLRSEWGTLRIAMPVADGWSCRTSDAISGIEVRSYRQMAEGRRDRLVAVLRWTGSVYRTSTGRWSP